MLVCTIQSVTKNSCISIFGDEVLMWVSEQYLQSHQVTKNKFQLLSVLLVLNFKYRYNLQANLLRPSKLLCNGTLS